MSHIADRREARFLNLLEKSLAIAGRVSSVNKRVAKAAQVINGRIEMSSIAATKSLEGISEGCLTPEAGYEMRKEDLLLASLDTKSGLSDVMGLLDSVLLVTHETGNPKQLAKTKKGAPVRPRDRLIKAMEARRAHFGYSQSLVGSSCSDSKPGFGC